MASLLNTSSMLMCPHGGTVSIVSANTRVKVGGDFAATSNDSFLIAGCPLNIGGNLHPCVMVRWVQPDVRSTVLASPTLSEGSIGLCVAADQAVQGTVQVVVTQDRVSGT